VRVVRVVVREQNCIHPINTGGHELDAQFGRGVYEQSRPGPGLDHGPTPRAPVARIR